MPAALLNYTIQMDEYGDLLFTPQEGAHYNPDSPHWVIRGCTFLQAKPGAPNRFIDYPLLEEAARKALGAR